MTIAEVFCNWGALVATRVCVSPLFPVYCAGVGLLACSNGTSEEPSPPSMTSTVTQGSSGVPTAATTPPTQTGETSVTTTSVTSSSLPAETTLGVEPGASTPDDVTSSTLTAPGSTSSTASSEGTSEATSSDLATSSDVEPATQPWVFTASTNGQLRAFALDVETGELTQRGDQTIGSNGGDVFIAMKAGSRQLFTAFNRGIAVFEFNPESAAFTERARGSTLGGGVHVGVAPGEAHAYVAHYIENTVSYLTYQGGEFSAPQGFPAGQRVHSAQESESGGWVLVPCLGSNHVAQYRRDGDNLMAATTATVAVAGGPRHLAYHPTVPVVYVLSELSSELRVFAFSEANGLGAVLDTEQFGSEQGGNYWASDVQVSPDGKDLFAVERNSRLVYHFDIEPDGTLGASGVTGDVGGVVRAFDISSDGRYLLIGNENGDLITFRFDTATNALTALPNPVRGLGTIHTTLVREL